MPRVHYVPGFLLIVAMLGMLLSVSPAVGSVAQYSAAAAANPNAIVQYGFDGLTDVEQRQDSAGDNDLEYFGGTAVTFSKSGFDWSSEAFRPNRGASDGLITSNAISLPETASFDAIVRPDTLPSNVFTTGYAFGSKQGNNRNYWLLEISKDQTGQEGLYTLAGDGYNSGHWTEVGGSDYTADDWYYVAVTMSYDSGTNKTTINTWSANLSSGQRTLTPVSTNFQANGTFANSLQMGVGILNNGGTPLQPFIGDIDEISLYGGLLTQDDFQSHLDQIYIPEPATVLIWSLLAGLAIGLRRRRSK